MFFSLNQIHISQRSFWTAGQRVIIKPRLVLLNWNGPFLGNLGNRVVIRMSTIQFSEGSRFTFRREPALEWEY